MTQAHRFRTRAALYAVLASLLLSLAAAGARELSVARAQAESYIEIGRNALQTGDRAQASLAFERARLLAPRAAAVRAALASVNARQASVAAPGAWLGPRQWSLLAVASAWALGLSLSALISWSEARRVARRIALSLVPPLLIFGACAWQSSVSAQALAVAQSSSGVLVAPYEGAAANADLKPGAVLEIGERYGAFRRVRSLDGARGWVASNAITPVVGS